VKPARFDYVAPTSVDTLLALLSGHREDAAVLAGGQSLLPLLNRRRIKPALLIDLNHVAGIEGISLRDGFLRIGCMTRQREIEFSAPAAKHAPLLHKAIKFVGNPATRNRGTLGGSIAFADPHAELPACMVALGATFQLASETGNRTVPATEFFRGRQKTALRPTEALLSIDIPTCPGRPCAFIEISRRAGDQAMVGVAACVQQDGDAVATVFGVAEQPLQLSRADLNVDWQIERPLNDENLSHRDRLHIARVLAQRAFEELFR
jgi:aerobic carbon-monoxide dehydrogenase medium subunit